MKGLSQMMWLMVSAIVIIIVALVILAMFTNIFRTNPLLDFENQCRLKGQSSCRAANELPGDWSLEVPMGAAKTSCEAQLGYTSCPSEWLQ